LNILPKDPFNCPYLILAPMEGVGDQAFRKAMAFVGGFDEAVADFLRVPINAHVKSLACRYYADETKPVPLAAQIMGSDPGLMAAMAKEIEKRGAPRIDLNCGCPSNTVTTRGAGSSLLKDPNLLHENAKAIVNAVSVPVTVKMRSGYEDISLFKENLFAAQESGISYLTLHPRTKAEGYGTLANWDLIAKAKQLLRIPVVGNGDIFTVADSLKMLSHTKCDALMIGRGSLINPFIFQQIRCHFAKKAYHPSPKDLYQYIHVYLQQMPSKIPEKTKINKMKQLMSFLFEGNSQLMTKRRTMLTNTVADLDSFLQFALSLLLKSEI
jgi:nifR3 family TIM-barrel protein